MSVHRLHESTSVRASSNVGRISRTTRIGRRRILSIRTTRVIRLIRNTTNDQNRITTLQMTINGGKIRRRQELHNGLTIDNLTTQDKSRRVTQCQCRVRTLAIYNSLRGRHNVKVVRVHGITTTATGHKIAHAVAHVLAGRRGISCLVNVQVRQ